MYVQCETSKLFKHASQTHLYLGLVFMMVKGCMVQDQKNKCVFLRLRFQISIPFDQSSPLIRLLYPSEAFALALEISWKRAAAPRMIYVKACKEHGDNRVTTWDAFWAYCIPAAQLIHVCLVAEASGVHLADCMNSAELICACPLSILWDFWTSGSPGCSVSENNWINIKRGRVVQGCRDVACHPKQHNVHYLLM